MSIAPECILANEAEVPYAAIAMVTDYDCWKQDEEPVTWNIIKQIMKDNSENVKKVLLNLINSFSREQEIQKLKDKIRTVPDFPKPGIMFKDITTLLSDKESLERLIEILYEKYKDSKIDLVAGIESRGFIIGSILANKLKAGFVPIRKPGKLPYETLKQEYFLEYGKDSVEIHKDAIKADEKVLLVDDLIATGGTALASCNLIEQLKGNIVECCFIIELPDLKGREKLSKWPVFSVIKFERE
jgi:adenine phosphoribosyltransferase